MIEDGYTFTYGQFKYRPLASFGRGIAKGHYEDRNFSGLDKFLWNEPHFYGDESLLGEEDKIRLFTLMMEVPVRDLQENLSMAVEIILTEPLLAKRTCSLCRKWWFDSDTGLISVNELGPIKRPLKTLVPCETNTGCRKGHYDSPVELCEINKQVWDHYLEWRAVGPRDDSKNCPIMRRNWAILDRLVKIHGFPELRF